MINKKALILSLGLTLPFSGLKAQSFAGDAIRAGVHDGTELLKSYLNPYVKAFGSGLNGGWYNTAKTHGLGRPDLTISFNIVSIPSSDKSFDISELPLSSTRLADPSKSNTPTIAGDNVPGPYLDIYTNVNGAPVKTATFQMPQGTGIGFMPVPTAQLGIGLVKNTDIMIRFIPTLNIKNVGRIGLWGVGVKHDILQWIPGVSAIPVDVSFLFGFTRFSTTMELDVPPSQGVLNPNPPSYEDQTLSMTTSAYTFGLLVSKKLSVLTLYGGLGYDGSSTTIKLNGYYPANTGYDVPSGTAKVENFQDPVNTSISGANSPKATLGLRFKLAVLTFHGDYTFSKYPMLSGGIGISIGN
jgi:hypothetical protein